MPTLSPIILTDEQLLQVEEMAGALLPADEIAILLLDSSSDQSSFVTICRNHVDSPIYQAFHRGRLRTKYELRKMVVRLAKAGSPAAEPLADKYLKDSKL